jgi:hypothetical protein
LAAVAKQVTAASEAEGCRLLALGEALQGQQAKGEEAAEQRMTTLAAEVQRAMGEQAERAAAFEQRLVEARGESAANLTERFNTHATALAERLAETATLVEAATDRVAAGGAEMESVAEMFLAAVDRYREASDRWLANLGAIEDAIDQRDAAETADLLGAYLAQTREVFDTHLQFQRELFKELRALRERPELP